MGPAYNGKSNREYSSQALLIPGLVLIGFAFYALSAVNLRALP